MAELLVSKQSKSVQFGLLVGSMKRLGGFIWAERLFVGVGFVFLVASSVAGLAYPFLMSQLIDSMGSLHGQLEKISIDSVVFLMFIVFSVQSVTASFRHYFFSLVGERIVLRLRRMLYASLLKQDVEFFDIQKTGNLLNRLTSDTVAIQESASVQVSIGLRHSANFLGGLVLMFYTSVELAVIMLLAAPPLIVISFWIGKKLRILSRKMQDQLAVATERAQEAIAGLRVVRIFSAEDREIGRYDAAIGEAFDISRRRYRISALLMGVGMLAVYGVVGLVLWRGGVMVGTGEMSVGTITSFMLYAMLVAFAVGGLSELWGSLMGATGAVERVFEILDREPKMMLGEGKQLDDVKGDVRFEGVHFAYPSRPDVLVLEDISLVVPAGTLVALVGPSGSGKSTMAALVLRLYDPIRGRICVDDQDIRELDSQIMRNYMGVVSQDPILFSMSIADNIRYGKPRATRAEVEAAAKAANAHDFIIEFPENYETQVGERGIQLSGGQRQRVAIARAILRDPKILILDEATSALDARSEHLVQEALDRLMKGPHDACDCSPPLHNQERRPRRRPRKGPNL